MNGYDVVLKKIVLHVSGLNTPWAFMTKTITKLSTGANAKHFPFAFGNLSWQKTMQSTDDPAAYAIFASPYSHAHLADCDETIAAIRADLELL